jgi:hypothetical protein
MLNRILAVALLTGSVFAQANAVAGLDIGAFDVTDISYQGRRGAAYPNGEAGFMVGHSWCNGGSVNLPWLSQSGGVMVDSYPRMAFLLARESGGRMVQVSGKSYCKHSPFAFNFTSGPCAPCNAGSGAFFYVGCSDTYGSGTNASQYSLGPTDEIDPWLGTWNPSGSYFDRGDPPVTGAAAIDSVRSLTSTQVAAFDVVKNRMVVRESELIAGATYYGQVHAMVQGEPAAARGNNLANRQVTITGSGGNWSAATSGSSQTGSVLTRWQGATNGIGGNGNDDGRFLVAVKVTGPVGGMWHYEYAVHNLDNNRGGASFRVPLAAGATVQNPGFRDIDADPLDDWAFSQTSTEIAFTAVGTNALDWNTIYNCWFDCSIPPGAGAMTIDEARVGSGALSVQVPADVPSGLAYATKVSVGANCGRCQGSFYEFFQTSAGFDLAGRSMTMTLNGSAYSVVETPVAFVPAAGVNLGLGLNTQTTVTLPFTLPYPGGSATQLQVFSPGYVTPPVASSVQLLPTPTTFLQGPPRWAAAWTVFNPIATSSANVWFDANATRAILTWNGVALVGSTVPNTVQIQFFPNGTVQVLWQNLASSNLAALVGWTTGGEYIDPGTRDLSATLSTPLQLCGPAFDGLVLDASSRPVLGTTLQWQLTGIPAGTAWGGLFRSLQQATPPIDLTALGMPGCFQYVVAPVTTLFWTPGSTLQLPETIPNSVSLVGVTLVGQAAIYVPPLTPLGVVASNGIVLGLGL